MKRIKFRICSIQGGKSDIKTKEMKDYDLLSDEDEGEQELHLHRKS